MQHRNRKQVNVTVDPATFYILNKFKGQNRNRSFFVDEMASFWFCHQKFRIPDENIVYVKLSNYGPMYVWVTEMDEWISSEFRNLPDAVDWLEKEYKIKLS